MSEKILEVTGLKKQYSHSRLLLQAADNKAVDNVSFSINKGSTTGLIGESGCGKSTVGKTILNLIKADGGKVVYGKETLFDVEHNIHMPSSHMKRLRKEMQMIFQDPASCLDPRKNVEQIISEGMKKHKICPAGEVRSYCARIMEQCGLDSRLMMKYPHEFSGGQRQRIGIARALALSPSFIVCDEPTAALDVSVQSQILNLMLDMKEKYNLTYLFISHNLGIVEQFCDNIMIMYLGKIVEIGKSRDIFSHPAHPYTKLLLNSAPATHPSERKAEFLSASSIGLKEKTGMGCRFANRCPYSKDVCWQMEPEMTNAESGHWAACHVLFQD